MNNLSVTNILDLPDEILVKIILYFNARERLTLANSCPRFHDLVFGDPELLRNLDFTRERQLMKDSDIEQYFNDENGCKKIVKINAENMWHGMNLSSSIIKATNLVDINILNGMLFGHVEYLSSFLQPLIHLKRLSVNWPVLDSEKNYNDLVWMKFLEEPFGRLTYLSLNLKRWTKDFLLILQLCRQLEDLSIHISREPQFPDGNSLHGEPMKLKNLRIIRLIVHGNSIPLRQHFMAIVPDPAEWTDFHIVNAYRAAYFERNLEVCVELEQIMNMPLPRFVRDFCGTGLNDKCSTLACENLLTQAIRITHQDAPDKFCCLSFVEYSGVQLGLLEIDEAKKLLKDPGYQISYLNFSHATEINCDIHLLASAFPNLKTLVLCRISNRMSRPRMGKKFQRSLQKKGSLASDELGEARDTDSSFKMLIENTPLLKVLMICPTERCPGGTRVEGWDLEALHLISGWKNLTVIRLCYIPIKDGKFLIDIGRECKKLETVELHSLGPDSDCSYECDLLEMLEHCKNLRKFSIRSQKLKHMSEMFGALSNCSKLEYLDLEATIEVYDYFRLESSFEKILRQSQRLNKFSFKITPPWLSDKLELVTKKIISELNRQDFQLNAYGLKYDSKNSSEAFFPSPLVAFPHRE